jgi:hypothetical protein
LKELLGDNDDSITLDGDYEDSTILNRIAEIQVSGRLYVSGVEIKIRGSM